MKMYETFELFGISFWMNHADQDVKAGYVPGVHEWYEATIEFACRSNQPTILRCLRRRVALEN